MTLPAYPEYKDSGVAWLGEVPSHWKVAPLKRVTASIESGTSVNATDVPASQGEPGVLKTSCVYSGEFDGRENKAVVLEEYDRVSCPVKRGSLIVSRMNTPDLVGAAGLVRDDWAEIFLPDRLWQVHFCTVEAAFVHFWTRSDVYRAQVRMACAGASSSMQNLGQDQFLCFVLGLPPLFEQAAIAAFLDRETCKIDALISEQDKLIELLREKRQAVISHAVTKGLDPTAPLKNSGIEWLGEVPAHWDVGPLKRHWSVLDCKHVTADFVDDGIPLASIREVQSRYVNLETAKMTTEAFYELLIGEGRRPEVGDLLFSRNATVGEVAEVTDRHPPFAMGQDICLLRKSVPELSSAYLRHVLKSASTIDQLACVMIGSTFKRVNVEEIRALMVPMPPSDEQRAIVAYLDRVTAEADSLIAEAQSAIDLLKERRSALISAAVTGKIDVRGLVDAKLLEVA